MKEYSKRIPRVPRNNPVRIGNFKLWRNRFNASTGDGKCVLDCIHVSNLDGSWLVRIPSTMAVYGMLSQAYDTTDEELRDSFLGMIFTNFYNLTTINSEALHDAFFFLQEMMSFPYLLIPEEEMCERMRKRYAELGGKDTKKNEEHIASMCEYRHKLYELIERKKKRFLEEYERQQALQKDSGDMEYDEAAENALEALRE